MEQITCNQKNQSSASFSQDSLELLLYQINSYPLTLKFEELWEKKEYSYSYINGVKLIMDNLLELYNSIKSSPYGGGKIYALNLTVNKSVLADFFKGIKSDLGITERIFQGGSLDLPVAKKLIDELAQKYEFSEINIEAFIFGAKKIAKVIDYAYHAPLTKPFQHYIIQESKSAVKNISKSFNKLIEKIYNPSYLLIVN
jgi:hypothetical protein